VNKTLGYVTALLFAIALVGCGDEKSKSKSTAGGPSNVKQAKYEICPKCGEVEGSTKCCVTGDDVTVCKKCGRHEGSPGCCVKGDHIHLCEACGAVYEGDSDHTCKITDKCDKCSRQKGSPGCCLVVEMKDKAAVKTEKTKTDEKTEKTKTEKTKTEKTE
jgi:hypothetical protein